MMRKFQGFAVFCLAVMVLQSAVNARISCKDDNNNDVSWFFIYKFPNSYQYVYVDSETPDTTTHWKLSSKKISSDKGALAHTIASKGEATDKPEDLIYAAYNDEQNGKSAPGGHTKGFFMFDKETGVWVIHSVPSFPAGLFRKNYVYPSSGKTNAQVALCVTFKSTQLETIAEHLLLQHPNMYSKPRGTKKKEHPLLNLLHPHLNNLMSGNFRDQRPWVLATSLWDFDGTEFKSFAKHGNHDEDVYSDLVAPGLESSLRVSTWSRTGDLLPPHCDGRYSVVNIQSLSFNLGTGNPVVVQNTKDHSKWAISSDKDKHYVCVGTLNREDTQKRRGGETLCFQNRLLHNLLSSTVTATDLCASKRPREEDLMTIG